MTKRNGNFNENASKKKVKVDEENFDALWGDDLDVDDVDDCLLLATQKCEEEHTNVSVVQRNNDSILPNYSFFKRDEHNLITSTQSFNKPTSTCRNGLQRKADELQAQYEAKEGEVSILRSQLKQLKANSEAEQTKREKKWAEKLQSTTRELNAIKSELEFKNLEIVNLKNKVSEISKNYLDNNLNSSLQCKPKGEDLTSFKLVASLEKGFPLKNIINSDFFSPPRQEHFPINIKYHLSSTFNMKSQQDQEIIKHSEVIARYNEFNISAIFPHVSSLMNLGQVDLDSELAVESVYKILCMSVSVLQSFLKYFNILEGTIQSETVRQRDILYLDDKLSNFNAKSSIFGNEQWHDTEIGVKARQLLAVLAAILPYNSYLRLRILEDDSLFTLLLNTISIAGKLRLSEQCIGFLCGSVKLLTSVAITNEFSKCCAQVYEIIRETVFSRPPMKVLECLAVFFKQASLNIEFVRNLCKTPRQRSLRVNTKEGILYYNKESCVLQVFSALYDVSLKGSSRDTNLSLTMLHFVNQLLNSNVKWMHFEENNHCDCICKVINLSLKIMHETTTDYKFQQQKLSKKDIVFISGCRVILNFSIDVLHTIMFKCIDLINKYSVDAQYKFIVKTLIDFKDELCISDQDYETLRNLVLLEETHEVNRSDFRKVPLWC